MEVTVCTGTFGGSAWGELANGRARASIPADVPWVHTHAGDLTQARNIALERVETEWVIYLDADDELEPGYVEAMEGGSADLRAPSVRYVQDGRSSRPRIPKVAGHHHACTGDCLPEGNWLVIGTAVRADLLREVGGWRDFPWSEDWSSWLRCWLAGATVEAVPDAVYRAYVRPDSRNRGGATQAEKIAAHKAIYDDAYGVTA